MATTNNSSSVPSSREKDKSATPDAGATDPSAMDEDGSEGERGHSTETPAVISPSTTETGTSDTLATTEDAAGSKADAARAAWAKLLPLVRNWHKTVYTLQIIDALLLPARVKTFSVFSSM